MYSRDLVLLVAAAPVAIPAHARPCRCVEIEPGGMDTFGCANLERNLVTDRRRRPGDRGHARHFRLHPRPRAPGPIGSRIGNELGIGYRLHPLP